MENIIFKVRVGSHAYGTNIEGSDEDFKGVYIQSPEDVLERGYQEQVNVSKDECYYEIKRFVKLCCTGNPTMLEILYSPEDCVLFKDPVFNILIENRHKFLSKSCKYSFGGYAYAQIEKAEGLEKKMNWEKSRTERKTVLDFCYIYDDKKQSIPIKQWIKTKDYKQEFCGLSSLPHFRYMYNVFYDHVKDISRSNPRDSKKEDFTFKGLVSNEDISNDISLSEIPEWYRNMSEGLMYFNKDEYSIHCRDYKSYTEWLEKRNKQRYVDSSEHGQKIDGKNLLHCYRLLETGIEIAKLGIIKVRRDNAEFLIGIRKGKYDLNKLLIEAKMKVVELEDEFNKSNLPDKVDRGYFMKLLTKIRKEFYVK